MMLLSMVTQQPGRLVPTKSSQVLENTSDFIPEEHALEVSLLKVQICHMPPLKRLIAQRTPGPLNIASCFLVPWLLLGDVDSP